MDQNLVDATLTQTVADEVDTSIENINSKLNFKVSLSQEEKSVLFKMGNGYKPFVDKAATVIKTHPEIMPGTFGIEAFNKDYALIQALEPIRVKLNLLYNSVEDTVTAVGSDAIISSLSIYDAVKNNKDKVPGLSAVYDEMKKFFPRKKAADETPKNPTA
jgi:hypothetical protein